MANAGDNARWYANRKGWTLLRRNVMVEGDRDVRYFKRAACLYFHNSGKSLLGRDLSILAAGSGDRGGTAGIYEEFPTLVKIIQTDCDLQGKALFRVVALLDNDRAGNSLVKALLSQYRSMKKNRDLFLLNRVFPRNSSEPGILSRQIEIANSAWKGLDCEIEDLLGTELIDGFLSGMTNALARPPAEAGSYRHYEWRDIAKGHLALYAKENAMLRDVTSIVEILKSLRFYLGLNPEGV